jgi:hypothetical protein
MYQAACVLMVVDVHRFVRSKEEAGLQVRHSLERNKLVYRPFHHWKLGLEDCLDDPALGSSSWMLTL